MGHRRLLPFMILLFVVRIPSTQAQTELTPNTAKPNILWITSEDNGPQLGCYGDSFADTPHIDAIAKRGMIYNHCWSNAPVCAPARTTIISGVFPTSLSAQHMRSHVALPPEVKLIPQYLRELGYYCTNNSKEDYNLVTPKDLWNESSNKAHWRKRKAGQPFFAVFNFTTSHESQIRTRPHKAIHDPEKVPVPPYHPDTPQVRQDWAQYYDKITAMDQQVGKIMAEFKQDGLEEETIIFYYGDHGSGMPRSKRWLYQSGLRVPMVIYVPPRFRDLAGEQYKPESTNDRLISFVDLLPTLLSLTGQPIANHLQGKAFLGKQVSDNPKYIYGFRDRMDERIDMSRTVRDNSFHYVRNFYPHRPQGAYLDYMFQTPTTQVWKKMFDEGKLNAAQSAFWKAKVPEELYDLKADPFELNNLAGSAEHQPTLERMRAELKSWMLGIRDLGLLPEGEVLQRAGQKAPYTIGHDENIVPIEKLFDAADLASRPQDGDLETLLVRRSSPEVGVRYWTVCGLLYRGQLDRNRDEVVKAARAMVGDPSPYVRCVVHEIIARWGSEFDRTTSLNALLQLSNARIHGLFPALMALNHIDWCGLTSKELGNAADGLPDKVTGVSARYDSYLPRLIERLKNR
jgi:arylsulfatase A-like enzyme